MRLVHLAKRIVPFWPPEAAARGAAELPIALSGRGHEVTVVAAAPVTDVADFKADVQFARRLDPLVVGGDDGSFEVPLLEGTLVGSSIRLHLLVLPQGRTSDADFGRAALALIESWPTRPELIHLHADTGLDVDAMREQLEGPAVVQSVYATAGAEASLAAAIHDADEVVTPCTDLTAGSEENGSLAAQALREHGRVQTVAHGIDLGRWDPARDSALAEHFSVEDLAGKSACRSALQRDAGLAPRPEVPILVVWSEAGPTSGLPLIAEVLEELLALDVQLVVLRPAGADAEATVPGALLEHDRVWVTARADEASLRRALAGADAVVLPDTAAPLGQRVQIALRYGLVPLARRINAHLDRLVEFDLASGTGGAFLWGAPAPEELLAAAGRLCRTFRDPEVWGSMVRANGAADFGWARAAAQLEEIYRKAQSR